MKFLINPLFKNQIMTMNQKEKHNCPCGSNILKTSLKTHLSSKKHLKFLEISKLKNKISVINKEMDVVSKQANTQRNYRDRQRALLGDAEYRRIESEKRQLRKLKNKPVKTPKVEVEDDENQKANIASEINNKAFVEKLPLKALNKKKGDILESTNAQYIKRLKFLHKSITGRTDFQPSNLEWLRDVDNILKFIDNKWKTVNTRASYYNSITSILGRVSGFEEEYKKYGGVNIELTLKNKKVKENNLLSEREKVNALPWSKIMKLGDHIKKPRAKLIYGLYTEIPPRRLDAFRLMRIIRNRNQKFVKNLSKDFNYVYLDKRDIGKFIILNQYKTSSAYGTYNANIPVQLGKIIQNYVKHNQLKNCDLLFSQEKDCKIYTPSAFSLLVTNVFEKVTGKKIGVDLLRSSFISHKYNQRISINEKNELALAMGHSRQIADSFYNKINL